MVLAVTWTLCVAWVRGDVAPAPPVAAKPKKR
jgi:hypothetical protein